MANCVISGNEAAYVGSALSGYGSSSDVFDASGINCTIVDNPLHAAIGWFDGEFINCIVWEDQGLPEGDEVSYSCIKNWSGGGEGNISPDPPFADLENGDYRLLAGSPCIDAGITSVVVGERDVAGLPRVMGGVVDMGANEYPNGCYISLKTDQDMYTGADEMTIYVTAGKFGLPERVDIYAAIAFRGRELVFIPDLLPDWAPWVSGLELQDGPVFVESFVYPFSGSEPDGPSVIYAAVLPYGATNPSDALTNVVCRSFNYHRVGVAELHVSPDGTGDIRTIQEAIDASFDGDTIIVYPGTYCENIDYMGKSIVIRSVAPSVAQTVASTIIEGAEEAPVVILAGVEDVPCQLSGLTITGGAGGVSGPLSSDPPNSNATISDCIIRNNEGIGVYGCNGDIRNCAIAGNLGSGLTCCNGLIVNCLIFNNTYDPYGGGIKWCGGSVRNCTIAGNRRGVYSCAASFRNCIVWGNEFADIHESSSVSYCCTGDFAGEGPGNISSDPLFTTGPFGDFYLHSGSPCIDVGSQSAEEAGLSGMTTQAGGTPDVGRVDIGFHYPIP